MHLNKVYELSHVHKFKKPSECLHGHEEEKSIGIFFSKEEAQEKIKEYKKYKGFRDHPEGFCVREYIIDEIDNKSLNQLIEKYQSR